MRGAHSAESFRENAKQQDTSAINFSDRWSTSAQCGCKPKSGSPPYFFGLQPPLSATAHGHPKSVPNPISPHAWHHAVALEKFFPTSLVPPPHPQFCSPGTHLCASQGILTLTLTLGCGGARLPELDRKPGARRASPPCAAAGMRLGWFLQNLTEELGFGLGPHPAPLPHELCRWQASPRTALRRRAAPRTPSPAPRCDAHPVSAPSPAGRPPNPTPPHQTNHYIP